jgi:site-specific recombinase XerD
MATADKVGPAKTSQARLLPIELWPEADRAAWSAACLPAARLKSGGAASHLKPVTRDDYARHYGSFLSFLECRGLLVRDAPAVVNVTLANVNAYLAELKGRIASTTTHSMICALRRVAQFMAPDHDFAWLSEIGKDLAFVARPGSKFGRVVLTEVLVEAGLTLIHEAEISQNWTALARAFQVRNGLMIALLALCPIRRRNFTALEIGRSFVKIHDKWWIVLSASETKENRADERPIDELVTPFIDRYLDQHRPVLARSNNPPSALWLSALDGKPITAKQVARVLRKCTFSTVGVKVSPHLFRTSGASSAATLSGENPHLGSALLHHRDPRVTNAHYNRASTMSAAESFRKIVRQYETV